MVQPKKDFTFSGLKRYVTTVTATPAPATTTSAAATHKENDDLPLLCSAGVVVVLCCSGSSAIGGKAVALAAALSALFFFNNNICLSQSFFLCFAGQPRSFGDRFESSHAIGILLGFWFCCRCWCCNLMCYVADGWEPFSTLFG